MTLQNHLCNILAIFLLISDNHCSKSVHRISKYQPARHTEVSFSTFIDYIETSTKIYCVLSCVRHESCLSVSFNQKKCGLFAKSTEELVKTNSSELVSNNRVSFYHPFSEPKILCIKNGDQLMTENAQRLCNLTLKFDINDLDQDMYWGPWSDWIQETKNLGAFCMGTKGYIIQRIRTRVCDYTNVSCVGDNEQIQRKIPKLLDDKVVAVNFSENERVCNKDNLDPFQSLQSLCPGENGLDALTKPGYFWTGLKVYSYQDLDNLSVIRSPGGSKKFVITNSTWYGINFENNAKIGYQCVFIDETGKLYLDSCEANSIQIINPLCEDFADVDFDL